MRLHVRWLLALLFATATIPVTRPAGAAQFRPHPVDDVIQIAHSFGDSGCHIYAVNDLTWDEFVHPTQDQIDQSHACLGPKFDGAFSISWTAACFYPATADGTSSLPRSNPFMEWIPCIVDFSNTSGDPVDLSLDQFILVNDNGDASLGGPDPGATASFGANQFVGGPLADGDRRFGVMAFLAPKGTPPPIMLVWRTSLFFGRDLPANSTVAMTRFMPATNST